ncbi:unnamed protein product [Ostreobium quekettii]|uniref:Uncharacterized protein n=1 Tax=Ostreobium quekettii TaxID=121088 RepID=A0A8S1JE22_9CHLO|nr:unnamed protein product [Ostreobium quekettii]
MASALCNRLNRLRTPSNGVEFAAVVPMDGFHYYKAQLDSMKDPMKAYLHRGAHWTFDAAGFVAALRRIRETGAASLPSFDHGRGDPVEDDIKVQSGTRLVIVEGNYLLLGG